MTEITHDEVREALPELLHGNVDADLRIVLENHLRGCAECGKEMRVLQLVKDAPSFAPRIDAVKVAAAIPPYGGVPAERPSRSKVIWRMASAVAVVMVVVATFVSRTDRAPIAKPARVASAGVTPEVVKTTPRSATAPIRAPKPRAAEPARELQVAVGLDGLSDGSVAQLVKDLDGLDGLPSPEPENLGVGDPGT